MFGFNACKNILNVPFFYNIKMVRGLIVLIDIWFVVLGFPLERGNDDGEKISIVH